VKVPAEVLQSAAEAMAIPWHSAPCSLPLEVPVASALEELPRLPEYPLASNAGDYGCAVSTARVDGV